MGSAHGAGPLPPLIERIASLIGENLPEDICLEDFDNDLDAWLLGEARYPASYFGGVATSPVAFATDALFSDNGAMFAWAMDLDYVLRGKARRHLSIGLEKKKKEDSVTLVARVMDYPGPGCLSPLPIQRDFMAPAPLSALLLDEEHFKVWSDPLPLNIDPVLATSGNMSILKRAIFDPKRLGPIVVVNMGSDGTLPTDAVADILSGFVMRGSAWVINWSSDVMAKEVREVFGNDLWGLVPNTIRLFPPAGLKESDLSSALLCPQFDIRTYNTRQGAMSLLRSMGAYLATYSLPKPCEIDSVDGVEAYDEAESMDSLTQDMDTLNKDLTRAMLSEKKAKEETKAACEKMKEYEKENKRLLKENEEINQLLDGTDAEIARLQDKAKEARSKLSSVQGLAYDAQGVMNAALAKEAVIGETNRLANALMGLNNLPSDLCGVMRMVEYLWPDRIEFTANAFETAQDYKCSVSDAWRVLRTMATDLWDVWFGPNSSADRFGTFQARFPYELARTETSPTKKNRRLEKIRTIDVDGRKVTMRAHLKAQFNGQPFRVYFDPDETKKKIIVGICGPHPDSHGTLMNHGMK